MVSCKGRSQPFRRSGRIPHSLPPRWLPPASLLGWTMFGKYGPRFSIDDIDLSFDDKARRGYLRECPKQFGLHRSRTMPTLPGGSELTP